MLKSMKELFGGVSAPSLRPVLLEAARAEVVDEMKERAEKLGLGEGEVEAIVPSVMSVEIANGAREGVSDLSVRQAPRCGFGEVGDGGLIPDGMSLHVDPAAMSPGEVREVRLRNGNVVRFTGTAEGVVDWEEFEPVRPEARSGRRKAERRRRRLARATVEPKA